MLTQDIYQHTDISYSLWLLVLIPPHVWHGDFVLFAFGLLGVVVFHQLMIKFQEMDEVEGAVTTSVFCS